jgi:LEA14-like dessication related protein
VRAPEVNLASVRVGGIGLRGASLIAELDIENENDFDIETDSITYQLFANTASTGENWQSVLQRSYTQRIVIAEDKVTRVEIPIDFNYSDFSGAARTIIDRGMLNYRIQGQAFVREPLRRTVPFTKTGSVSLTGAR